MGTICFSYVLFQFGKYSFMGDDAGKLFAIACVICGAIFTIVQGMSFKYKKSVRKKIGSMPLSEVHRYKHSYSDYIGYPPFLLITNRYAVITISILRLAFIVYTDIILFKQIKLSANESIKVGLIWAVIFVSLYIIYLIIIFFLPKESGRSFVKKEDNSKINEMHKEDVMKSESN